MNSTAAQVKYEFNLGWHSLPLMEINSLILTFDLCLKVEENILKEIMQFHYMTYMATL